jgi:hypothetical protein
MPLQSHSMAITGESNMLIRKVLVSALFAAGMIGAAATPLPSLAAAVVYVNVGPPPDRHERIPEARRGYIWSPGYWDWRGNKHVWVKGSSVRERNGYAYQPQRWVERDGRWNLERSRWNQAGRRDSDRDGIPDRRDPTPYGGGRPGDRDGDGVPNNRDSRPNDPNRR